MRGWVNADLREMAKSLMAQAESIRDEEDHADRRRAHLHQAAAHLVRAFAELTEMPIVDQMPRSGAV